LQELPVLNKHKACFCQT